MIERIGIIGGTGQMGQMFVPAWEQLGAQVMVTDHTSSPAQEKALVTQSELVILSVPIDKSVEVLHRISGWLRPDQLLSDFTSVKSQIVPQMLKTPADVISVHPMFGQVESMKGQNLVFMPVEPGKHQQKYKRLLESLGLNLVVMEDWTKHDASMSFIQGLMHFIHITFTHTLSSEQVDLGALIEICSPIYRAHFAFASRILQRDPSLYSHILMDNQANAGVIGRFMTEAQESYKLIVSKDEEAFTKRFAESKEFFGHWGEVFSEESGYLIEKLKEYQEKQK